MGKHKKKLITITMLMLMTGTPYFAPTFAQSNAPDQGPKVRPEIPAGLEAETTEVTVKTPALPEGIVLPEIPETDIRSIMRAIYVDDIVLEGNTVLDDVLIEDIIAAYRYRELTFEDLQALKNQLTRAYIDRGYVNSGVTIPDQEVTDGIVRMTAHEGVLNEIRFSGNDALRNGYLEPRIRDGLGPVFNVHELQDSLQLLQQRPTIGQLNAKVLPGQNRGDSLLDLRVHENEPMTISAGFNNHRSPSVGEYQYIAAFAHRSLTGNADYLTASYGTADGFDDWYVGYGIPLTAGDLTFETWFSEGQSDIVEDPFESLDIVTDTRTWGIKLYRPVVYTLNHAANIGLIFENKQNESYLLGLPFSFSPGEELGESEVSALRLQADWLWRRANDALSMIGTFSFGVDWLNATDHSNLPGGLPDSKYNAILFQTQYSRRLPWWNTLLLGWVTAQFTTDPLLAIEKLAVGGARTVRGYRENQLVRDKGAIAGLELRIPLFTGINGESRIGLSLAPFFDYGIAKNNKIDVPGLDNPGSQDLMSVGAGLVWNWWEPLYAEAFYGESLIDDAEIDLSGDSLQEDGFHILVSLQLDF